MPVVRLSTLQELALLRAQWDRLAGGVPLRSWQWNESWWRVYGGSSPANGGRRELCTLAVFDFDGYLVGLAPWFLEHSASSGRVLRFLGSGEVCSDHVTVLCEPGWEERVATALAEWLTDRDDDLLSRVIVPNWDCIELQAVDARDRMTDYLLNQFAERGASVARRPGPNCWRLVLPETWDEYLAMLSKSHRKQLRRIERRMFRTGRAKLHCVERETELTAALSLLADLHQRRRESMGDKGLFKSKRFMLFQHLASVELLRAGKLRLCWLELDGLPAAVEYQLLGDGVVYAYQSGIEPTSLAYEPGRTITLAALRLAMSEGRRTYDFLRGDERYKAHWRAEPSPTNNVSIVHRRASAQLRHRLRTAGSSVRGWITSGLGLSVAERC